MRHRSLNSLFQVASHLPSKSGNTLQVLQVAAAKQEGNNLNGFEDLLTKNGSIQGQNLALTVVEAAYSLDSGHSGWPADYSQVDVLGLWYKSVNFGA